MDGWLSKLGNFFSNAVHGNEYQRQLGKLVQEDARLSREGKDPTKSPSHQRLEQKCRELAAKHGIEHHPG